MRRRIATWTALLLICASGTASRASQETPWDVLTGFPAYVTMQTYHPPAIAGIMGKTRLYYEIYVLNAYGADIDVTNLTVEADGATVASFAGARLTAMMRPLGRPNAKPSSTVAAGGTDAFYVELSFASAHDVPASFTDVLTFRVPEAAGRAFSVRQMPVRVGARSPILIGAPLAGDGWFAGDAPSNDTGHRRTIFFKNARPYLGQRFAIDWVKGKVDANGHVAFFHGDPKQNANWYGWNQPLYAVANGVVVSERTDLPDNVPQESPVVRISQETLGGNYVVIDIGFGRYAFYAHMRPHSATVKVGDRVREGQVLGRLGNSGNSSGPHLHFHVTDAPEFIFADGEPYAFATMRAATTRFDENDVDAGARITSPFKPYGNTMPGNGALVDFGPVSLVPDR